MSVDWRDHLADWTYSSDVLGRLSAAITTNDQGCWLWTKSRTEDGYGQISVKRMMIRCHQVAYHLYVGPVPAGLQLDHLCRNRACCNPWHLEPVTPGINSRRGLRSRWKSTITRCPQDHPYDEINTYVHPVTGHRTCRRCRADRQRRYDAARNAA